MHETTLRNVLLRVASIYRTASVVVVQMITRINSIDLIGKEKVFTYFHIVSAKSDND